MRRVQDSVWSWCVLAAGLTACGGGPAPEATTARERWLNSVAGRTRTLAGHEVLGSELCLHRVQRTAPDDRWVMFTEAEWSQVWNSGAAGELRLLYANGDGLDLARPVDVSPDGRFVGTRAGTVLTLLDTASRTEVALSTPAELWPGEVYGGRESVPVEDSFNVPYLRFSPDGRYAAYVRELQRIVVRELDTAREQIFDVAPRSVWSMSWDPSASWLVIETIAGGEGRAAAVPWLSDVCEDCGRRLEYGAEGRVGARETQGLPRQPLDVHLAALHLSSFRAIHSTARELAASRRGLWVVERDGSLSRIGEQGARRPVQDATCNAALVAVDAERSRALYQCQSTKQGWVVDDTRTFPTVGAPLPMLTAGIPVVFGQDRALLANEAVTVDLVTGQVELLAIAANVEQQWGARVVLRRSRKVPGNVWYAMDVDAQRCWAIPEAAMTALQNSYDRMSGPAELTPRLRYAAGRQRYFASSPWIVDLETLSAYDLNVVIPGLCRKQYGMCDRHEGDCTHHLEWRCGPATASATGSVLVNVPLSDRTDALIRLSHRELGEAVPLEPLIAPELGCH